MKSVFVLLLAAMTAWIAVTAHEMDTAHKAAGRPAKSRIETIDNPAAEQLKVLSKQYGTRQILFAGVGVAIGLFLALTVAIKILKLIALGCVVVLALVLWQAWERGYLTEFREAAPTVKYLVISG
jgi:NADH:ubiquinone oxidoreductase subunit 3 (subunit A)